MAVASAAHIIVGPAWKKPENSDGLHKGSIESYAHFLSLHHSSRPVCYLHHAIAIFIPQIHDDKTKINHSTK